MRLLNYAHGSHMHVVATTQKLPSCNISHMAFANTENTYSDELIC